MGSTRLSMEQAVTGKGTSKLRLVIAFARVGGH
jgi:hypothetical protein